MLACDYATLRNFGRAAAEQEPLSEAQQAALDALVSSYDAQIEEHGGDPEEAIATQLEDLSERIDALSSGNLVWTDESKARSGAIVSIAQDGRLDIERGLLRRAGMAAQRALQRTLNVAMRRVPRQIVEPVHFSQGRQPAAGFRPVQARLDASVWRP